MHPTVDFEQRKEWMDEQLEIVQYDSDQTEGTTDDGEQIIVWELESNPTRSYFVGTQSNQAHFDIIYRYNFLLELAMSLNSEEARSVLAEGDSDEIEQLEQEMTGFIDELEISITELINEYDTSLSEIANGLEMNVEELAGKLNLDVEDVEIEDKDTQLEPGTEGKDTSLNEEDSEDEHGDESTFRTDWIAANLRVNHIPDRKHARLNVRLNDIMSEGSLGYSIRTTEARRIHKFRLTHRLFLGEDELRTQDLYDSVRLVKSTGHYARNYLRYAFRIRDDVSEDTYTTSGGIEELI